MKIRTSKKAGFTLVEIMIVVAIIGLLAAIAIPNFVRARAASQMNACVNNLRQIDGAQQQYLLETGKDTVDETALAKYLGRGEGKLPVCPIGDTAYEYTATPPTCSKTTDEFPHVLPGVGE